MARLFLAINLPDELKKRLFELTRPLDGLGQIKLVEEENIHITLKFLGDAEEEEVVGLLEDISVEAFDVTVKGLGAFPSPKSPRVVWAGCEKGFDELVTLHGLVESRLKCFEKDRNFHPHATLGRVRSLKDKARFMGLLEKNRDNSFGSFRVGSFELMESKLSSGGPTYSKVKSFGL